MLFRLVERSCGSPVASVTVPTQVGARAAEDEAAILSTYPDDLWHSVAELSGRLLSEEGLETTLRRVADLAVRSIAGCDAAGVTLVEGGQPTTRTATNGLVYDVDQYQYDIGDGPCLQSVVDRRPYQIDDMAASDRWHRFCHHSADRGIHSSLSLPLMVRNQPFGALNLYSTRSEVFSPDDQATALMFASQAAVAIANAQIYASSLEVAEQLREGLATRAVIDHAIGILIGREVGDEDAALEKLRETSQRSHQKLRVIAKMVVDAAKRGDDPLAVLWSAG